MHKILGYLPIKQFNLLALYEPVETSEIFNFESATEAGVIMPKVKCIIKAALGSFPYQ